MTAILITGASSGLGAALARAYAGEEAVLHLGGRDPARLEAVAGDCRAKGARVETACLDVTDQAAMAAWVEGAGPLDLLIANAGISAGTADGPEGARQTGRILAVNVQGVVNTVMPALPAMRARGRGQIALMSSLASFRGVAGAPAYCASKAAVRVWGEGLRGMLAPEGIRVSVICPGFVETPMTAVNRFPMPMLMGVEPAARLIVEGLARNRGRIAFPLGLFLIIWLMAAIPDGLAERLARSLPRK